MGKKNSASGISFTVRIILIAVLFSFAAVFYITKLADIQLIKRSQYTSSVQKTYTRTVTIKAQRGEVFDRNGEALMTNVYTYDLDFDYGSLSKNSKESNKVILEVLRALKDTGNEEKRTESNFPLLGSYPNMIYDEKLMKTASYKAKFNRAIKELGFHEDKDGNPIENTAKELSDKLAEKYSLTDIDENGDPLYTNDEITELMKIRFDMAFVQFSTAEPYVFAKDVDLKLITNMKESELRGITFQENVTRHFEYPGYASHILGRVGPIHAENLEYYSEKGYKMNAIVGIDGCEKAFEDFLRGTDGLMKIEEDENGSILSQSIITPPIRKRRLADY